MSELASLSGRSFEAAASLMRSLHRCVPDPSEGDALTAAALATLQFWAKAASMLIQSLSSVHSAARSAGGGLDAAADRVHVEAAHVLARIGTLMPLRHQHGAAGGGGFGAAAAVTLLELLGDVLCALPPSPRAALLSTAERILEPALLSDATTEVRRAALPPAAALALLCGCSPSSSSSSASIATASTASGLAAAALYGLSDCDAAISAGSGALLMALSGAALSASLCAPPTAAPPTLPAAKRGVGDAASDHQGSADGTAAASGVGPPWWQAPLSLQPQGLGFRVEQVRWATPLHGPS